MFSFILLDGPDESIIRDGGYFLVATFVDDEVVPTRGSEISLKKRVSSCETEIIVNEGSFKTKKLTEIT